MGTVMVADVSPNLLSLTRHASHCCWNASSRKDCKTVRESENESKTVRESESGSKTVREN